VPHFSTKRPSPVCGWQEVPRPGACRGCCVGGPREAGSAFVQVRRVTSFRAVPWPCGRVLHECAHVCWCVWCHRCLRLFDECALAQHALRAHYYVAYVANTLFLLQLRACAGLALPVAAVNCRVRQTAVNVVCAPLSQALSKVVHGIWKRGTLACSCAHTDPLSRSQFYLRRGSQSRGACLHALRELAILASGSHLCHDTAWVSVSEAASCAPAWRLKGEPGLTRRPAHGPAPGGPVHRDAAPEPSHELHDEVHST
jgi:hypothetical protein